MNTVWSSTSLWWECRYVDDVACVIVIIIFYYCLSPVFFLSHSLRFYSTITIKVKRKKNDSRTIRLNFFSSSSLPDTKNNWWWLVCVCAISFHYEFTIRQLFIIWLFVWFKIGFILMMLMMIITIIIIIIICLIFVWIKYLLNYSVFLGKEQRYLLIICWNNWKFFTKQKSDIQIKE